MKYYVFILVAFIVSCTHKDKKKHSADRIHYKEVVNEAINNVNKFGRTTLRVDTFEKDLDSAYSYFIHGERGEHLYEIDTVGDFIFERSGFGYKFLVSDYFPGIDAWVVTKISNNKKAHFLNLINQHITQYILYGKEATVKGEIINDKLPSVYENGLNQLASDLKIDKLSDIQLVLSKLLGYRIRHKEELRNEAFLYELERSADGIIDQEELDHCKKRLLDSPTFGCIYSDQCDLYETPYRVLYETAYLKLEEYYEVKINLLLFECNYPFHISGYLPYSQKIELDRAFYSDSVKTQKILNGK